MHCRIEIEMDNAAFNDEDEDGPNYGPELSRILNRAAGYIADCAQLDESASGNLFDINGNNVGEWRFYA